MTSYSPKECTICQEEYDEDERCPRSLPCSHTLCSYCIGNLISRNSKTCPFCLRDCTASASQDIGVNTSLLDVLKLLREMERKVAPPCMCQVTTHSDQVNYVKRKTDQVINELLNSFQEADEEIDRNLQSNNQLKNSFLQANAIIKELLTENVKRIQYLEEHSRRMENQKSSIKEKTNVLREANTKLASAGTFVQVAPVADEMEGIKTDAQKSLCSFMQHLAEDEETRLKLEKVFRATKDSIAELENIVKSAGRDDEVTFTPDLKDMKIQEVIPAQITVEALRSRSGSVMELIRQGQIFAIQELEGRKRYAQITLEEKQRIRLHYLREQTIPSNAHLLQHSDVVNLMDVSSRLVFLELSSEEKKTLGKLSIRLSPSTKRAEQFALLCSGEQGHSYVKSNILNVFSKGTNNEQVWVGDYENLGGKGGKALMPDSWKEMGGVLKRPQKAGLVQGRNPNGGESEASQVFIYPRDNPGRERDWCFGMIEEGLSILKDAIAHHPDITKVFVSDAGMVLPI